LCAIATLLEEHLIRHVDFASRNGGDEFCALLCATPKGRAIERAQAFCDAVRAHDFGVAGQITVSIGVAGYPHDGTTAGALLEVADATMYHSKREGRDRVSFAALPGTYASLRAKAAPRLSRSPLRCRSNCAESSERRSSY
jgi:diguanylate cyclase (GGDEF)-like protein